MSKSKTVETSVEELPVETPRPNLPTETQVEFKQATQLPSDNTQTAGENAGNTQTQAEKTFTQAELENILKQRLEQERKKYADYDELKAKVSGIEDSSKSKQQGDTERLQSLEAQTKKLVRDKQELAIKLAAKDVGLDDVAAIKLIDESEIKIENDEVTNAADLVKAVAEKYPGLVQKRNTVNVPAINQSKSAAPTAEQFNQNRRREYFGGGNSNFWTGGGVQYND